MFSSLLGFYPVMQVYSDTVAIFKLSRMCILSTSFSGTASLLSRYASRPVGYKSRKQMKTFILTNSFSFKYMYDCLKKN